MKISAIAGYLGLLGRAIGVSKSDLKLSKEVMSLILILNYVQYCCPFKAVINKMIPKIRKMVSGARIRYEKEGFNLDLTYITDRILAMSFPAAGFQAIYRNHIDTVGFCSIKVA